MHKLVPHHFLFSLSLFTLLSIAPALSAAPSAVPTASSAASHPRTSILWNFGWRFHAGDIADGASLTLDDADWRAVDLPHDFQIEQPWVAPGEDERPDTSDPGANVKSRLSPRGFKEMGIGWYRKTFTPDESWRGRRVLIDFEGILYVGDAYLNGHFIGKTDYGYLGFEADITRLLKWGEKNVLAVRADTRAANNSRWYTGAGLYRDVHLITTDPVNFFTRHPLRITTNGTDSIFARVELTANEKGLKTVTLRARVTDNKGVCVAEQTSEQRFRSNQKTREYDLPAIVLPGAHRWDIDDPFLYTLHVELLNADGAVIDVTSSRFGIRQLEFSPEFGMKLNGRKVILKGIANHHTLGALGAAAYPRAIEKRLRLLKEFGFNHIRTSHNPYSESLLDLCDSLGILVVDELYDKWLTQYCGGRAEWTALWQHDIPEWIRRDRNHPSIVFWSLGNELQTYWNIPYADWGVTPYRMQKQLLLRYDDSRLITVAMHPRGRSLETDSLPAPLVMETDIAAYNYRYMYFPGDGRKFPWMMFYQSEATTAAMGPNYYEMDLSKVIGLAYWGAIDYLGESQGWPAKGWAQGVFYIDLTTKPNAYLAKSIFSDEPTVHLCFQEQSRDIEWNGVKQRIRRLIDHWTRTSGEALNLTIYTNCDEVELIMNGKSLGRKQNDRSNPKARNQIRWDKFNYEPGYIEAIARNAGKIVARHREETAGPAVALRLVPDLPPTLNSKGTTTPSSSVHKGKEAPLGAVGGATFWRADGIDLQHVRVEAIDKKGRVVPTANFDVTFTIDSTPSSKSPSPTGEGLGVRLAAVSSGDHYSDELTQLVNHRCLYEGRALAILRAGTTPAVVTLTATAEDLKPAKLTLRTY
ncbi:MAG: glycoside hydrolase family 2 protein [Prevotella sp.]|nr:glycoside hydrolase family 2 protein [Prevotella sp.]